MSQETHSLCREFERDLARNVKTNPKAFWRYSNSKLKNKPRLGDLKNSERAVVQGDKEKADLLNKYFASVYTQENIENLPSLDTKYDGAPLSEMNITADTIIRRRKYFYLLSFADKTTAYMSRCGLNTLYASAK